MSKIIKNMERKGVFKSMDNQVDDMFETIAKATRPTTQERNKKLDDLGAFLNEQMEKMSEPVKEMTHSELSELMNQWIDYLGTQAYDPKYKDSFTIGFMKGRLMSLLQGYVTPEETIKEMERVLR